MEIKERDIFFVDQIKSVIIDYVYNSKEPLKINFSSYIQEKIGFNYPHLSNIFSKIEGIRIEDFLIDTRIERVKDLISEGLSLTEIHYKLNYSSVQYLSNQFRNKTGLTFSEYKKSKIK